VASKSHRFAAPVAGFLLAASLSGCAASQTVDSALLSVVYNHAPPAAFKVPLSWNQVDGPALAREVQGVQEATGGSSGADMVAFEPSPGPRASDFLAFGITRPFMFIEYGRLNSAARRQMSDGYLHDFYLPVTAAARHKAAAQGIPLTGFRLVRDQVLVLGHGVHGVRETYDYTYTGYTDTFDVDAVTNIGHDAIFLVALHCTTACYGKYRTEIEAIMSSVSAISLVPEPPMWAGLVGR
jgi:hypothetical protein